MKMKLIATLMILTPAMASAAVPYRVQYNGPESQTSHTNNTEFARANRFYIGASYNLSMWSDVADNLMNSNGRTTSSFDISAGMRALDTLRFEANYIRADASWNHFSMTGDIVMLNAIVDARIDAMYRLFHSQRIVPYVGAGVGVSFNSADNADIENSTTMAGTAMVGVGFELGPWFTLDIGYRYLYIAKPKFNIMENLSPNAHQLRAGARINF